MASTFKIVTDVLLRETVLYIEPTSVSRHQRELFCARLVYFESVNNVPSVVVSPFNYNESVYVIGVNCKTYKPSDS